ncbi:MAG: glucose-6-phosphate dehydrogenase [Desulfobulbaceae bacterium]|nr:glucose-6-phosphate dehydrogenase [Desulfobulbaceae bacterium]
MSNFIADESERGGVLSALPCACSLDPAQLEPCVIVIFGASGDLTARKLVPALFSLFCQGSLPQQLAIVGAGRTEMTDLEFRNALFSAMPDSEKRHRDRWPEFASLISYVAIDYDSEASFCLLTETLSAIDQRLKTHGNRIFYLATPPSMYAAIGSRLGQVGLAEEGGERRGWSRLVVEKPFGHNLTTAVALDSILHQYFAERQVFRIDHYLAKETVQNVLMLRFANAIFEPIWNRNHIEYIGIVAAEELGVEHRAGYYEQAGVVRDMFQNHMLQLMALTCMEPPSRLAADRVRDEKIKVFRSLKSIEPEIMAERVILGQYGAGILHGKPVSGYREEPGVSPVSCTPTFAMTQLFIDNWRWRGVPVYLVSGKRMVEKRTRIVVQFKDTPRSMFSGVLAVSIVANRLVIGIYPQEKISLRFQAKGQGAKLCLSPVNMEFTYPVASGEVSDSYEKVLLDCILGDQMLFLDQTGIELAWDFLDPVISVGDCARSGGMLHQYPAGTWGPEAAREWMRLLID